jgi:8-oxo-(d)GTP phosphatase
MLTTFEAVLKDLFPRKTIRFIASKVFKTKSYLSEMNIFINDFPITVIDHKKLKDHATLPDFDVVIDCRLEILKPEKLSGHCLLLNVETSTIDRLWDFLFEKESFDFQSLTIAANNKEEAAEHIKSYYKIVKAAGGVVQKDDTYLLIYRLKRWDLPKGKLEAGEKSAEGALREVEEECGVKVSLGEKICTTWHTYNDPYSDKKVLKRTKWYRMGLLSGDTLIPQAEEGIEKVEWLSLKEARKALANSYSSIRFVFEKLQE